MIVGFWFSRFFIEALTCRVIRCEALKRAEALRAQERAQQTFDVDHVAPSIPLHGADDYYELRRTLLGSAVGDTVRSESLVRRRPVSPPDRGRSGPARRPVR